MPESKIKIIHLLHHLPLPSHLASTPDELKAKIGGEYILLNKAPYWIGFWSGDLHVKTALETLKRYSDYEIECWRPYGNGIREIFEKDIDGIHHKVFPCRKHYIPDGHSRLIARLLIKLRKLSIPVIYQHRSSKFAIYSYKNLKGIKKLNIVPLFIFRNQVKALNSVTQYLTDSKNEIKFLRKVLKFKRVVHFKLGIDFTYFKPDMSNEDARKKLKLPQNKKIILYVGRFYSDKNVDKVIQIFKQIKSEDQSIELVLVGGYKSDEFYEMGIQVGAIIRERVPENELKYYYLAANVYVMPTFNDTVVRFGGFGNAPIQALACNLPIISKNIMHFPGTYIERDQIGLSYKNEKDLAAKIEMVLLSDKTSFQSREVAKKYYDLDVTIKELYKFYQSVSI
jgi:glycosyltransferase involved in cell wall biosynthesis